VAVSYAVGGETVRFSLGDYDHGQALVIDPILSYFSYLGGTGADYISNANPGVRPVPSLRRLRGSTRFESN
jgi:hypothetical protein